MLPAGTQFVRITSRVHSHGCDGTPKVMLVRGYPHMWWKCCPASWWISTVVGATSCVPASTAASVAGAAAGAGVAATVGAAAGAGATAATAAGAGAPAVDSTSATVKPSAL